MRIIAVFVCLAAVWALAAPGDETTFEMQWQKDCFNRTDQVTFDRTEVFAVEPDTQGRDVKRGILKIGPEDAGAEVGLLWDTSERRLYVDVNRDGDLTNDPDGQLSAEVSDYQDFKNLELSFENESGIHRYQTALYLNTNGYYHWVHVRSGYGGSVELGGRKWTIQANDGFDAKVGQQDLLSVFLYEGEGKNRIWSANMPESVFLDGRLYDVAFEFKKGDDGFARLRCTLKERDVPTGTLQVKGQWINQLVLGDGSMLVLPELSEQPVTVPAGAFNVRQFALQWAENKPAVSIDRITKIVSVPEGDLAEVAIGGPLKSSVNVNRRGNTLVFSYKLLGCGGEEYVPSQVLGYESKPMVTIYKGETQLASGTFEYG